MYNWKFLLFIIELTVNARQRYTNRFGFDQTLFTKLGLIWYKLITHTNEEFMIFFTILQLKHIVFKVIPKDQFTSFISQRLLTQQTLFHTAQVSRKSIQPFHIWLYSFKLGFET